MYLLIWSRQNKRNNSKWSVFFCNSTRTTDPPLNVFIEFQLWTWLWKCCRLDYQTRVKNDNRLVRPCVENSQRRSSPSARSSGRRIERHPYDIVNGRDPPRIEIAYIIIAMIGSHFLYASRTRAGPLHNIRLLLLLLLLQKVRSLVGGVTAAVRIACVMPSRYGEVRRMERENKK